MAMEIMRNNTTPRRFYNAVKKAMPTNLFPFANYSEWADVAKEDEFEPAPFNLRDPDDKQELCVKSFYYHSMADMRGKFPGGIFYVVHVEFNFDDEKTGWGYAYASEVA